MENKSFKNFLVVWFGQLISAIGSGLTAFVLGVYAYELTNTATSAALVVLFSFVPSILLSPIGGVFADRFDRRAMMIIGDVGAAAGIIFILVIMLTGEIELWQIYLGVAVSSIFVGLQSPTYKASATDLLTEEQFSQGSGLVQLAEASKFLFSPIIAGLLLLTADITTILILDISTFLVATLAVFVIKKGFKKASSDQENQNFLKDFKEGWKAMTTNKGVLMLVIIISLVTFYLGFLQTLLGPMVLSSSNAQALGGIQSFGAVGMILSSLFIGVLGKNQSYFTKLVIGLIFAGIAFSLIGMTSNIYFIAGAAFLFLSSLPFVNTSADVLVRKNIDNEKQGRVWGIIGILSQLGFVFAYSIAGFLADKVFTPLLDEGGYLAPTIGEFIGVGPGRGIGLLFIISGISVVILAVIISKTSSIKALDNSEVSNAPFKQVTVKQIATG